MIDLGTLARVRLWGGTLIHAVTPPGGSATACGQYVRIGPGQGRRDEPLPPDATLTCDRCQATTDGA